MSPRAAFFPMAPVRHSMPISTKMLLEVSIRARFFQASKKRGHFTLRWFAPSRTKSHSREM